ncbi:MotA/TolQ/ExbB proton channel family protein [Microbulbifer hainanensis]|uniref:MotA/TolQ/ExbB proton channel family protein n=1 Tax=Microbulbifer hainanensis TaxID=2735675 RepID=UPI0018664CF7|nr:MotA/TolQ/ExbB proton channel family protein [Microbulbifer hainanensis]
MDFFNSVIAFFQTGGTFMYPILLVAALGIAIAVERYIRLIYERHTNRAMWDKLQPVLNSGDFDRARNLVKQDNSGVSKVLAMGLARQGAVRRREDIEIAMEESMMEIIPQLEKRTPYIALLSNIATLLGLLGTIMGLIEAFTAVANANPAEKADLLSASISVAMNTTAFGLMTGIPLLLVHAWLNSLTGEIVDSLEMVSVKALNLISMSTRRRRDVNAEDGVSESRVAEPAVESSSNAATATEETEESTPEVAEESADEEPQLEKV